MSTETVATSAKDLRRILTVAAAFTDPEDDLPPLSHIYLEAAGGVITATGSDRYVLGHIRATATGNWDGGVLVDRDQAEWIASGLDILGNTEVVDLARLDGGNRLRIHHREMSVEVPSPPEGRSYPDYRALFGKFDGREPSLDAPVLLNTHVLEFLGKLNGLFGYGATRWTVLGANEPIRVEVGDSFAALVMPAKQDAVYRGWPVPIGTPQPAAVSA